MTSSTATRDDLAPADGTVFTLHVDHSKSLDRLVRLGEYDYAASNINEDNFPVDPRLGDGELTIEAALIHLDREATGDEALKEVERRGFRPATMFELVTFGVRYPKQQCDHTIVELGSIWMEHWQDVETLSIGHLAASPGERTLGLDGFHFRWVATVRYLAVTK